MSEPIHVPTVEEVIQWSKESKLSQREIARRSGVPLATVNRVLSGQTQSPGAETLMPIAMVVCPIGSMPDINVDGCCLCRTLNALERNLNAKERWLRIVVLLFVLENVALVLVSLTARLPQ